MEDNSQDYSEELLRNPKPGTAAAAARDFGIDLTLTIENLRLSVEDRIRQNDDFVDAIREIRAIARLEKRPRVAAAEIRVTRALEAAKEYLRNRDQEKAATHGE